MPTLELFDYQQEFIDAVASMPQPVRTCLFYRTGAGKSLTAVLGLKELGRTEAVVIAPPATHNQWEKVGEEHDLAIRPMSHAKFRMRTTKLDRGVAVIADEFHMLGGQQGQGWRKLDTLARGLQAPMVLLSATPNYNDAERVYCVQHILEPLNCRGGYLQFLYQHCHTMQDPFSQTPKVTGFRNYPDACAFLADLPRVFHVPDEAVIDIVDIPYRVTMPDEMVRYGLDIRGPRIFSSRIERTHTERVYGLVGDDGLLRYEVMKELRPLLNRKMLVFCNHASVARALARTLEAKHFGYLMVTGSLTRAEKLARLERFLEPGSPLFLIGTASLATGTDGLDQVCDRLVILDDTDDDALRRQLLGRILPRGATVVSDKDFFRLTPDLRLPRGGTDQP